MSYTTSAPGAPPGERTYEELKSENLRLRNELTEARMERELFKKSSRGLCVEVDARYVILKKNRLIYPLKLMSRVLGV